jgi:hypothetical protein
MAIAAKNENICPNGRMKKKRANISSLRHKIEQRGAAKRKLNKMTT